MKLRTALIAAAIMASACPTVSNAWGNQGHELVAEISWAYMTPKARARVQALLDQSIDPLTPPDYLHRATWADQEREVSRTETKNWHFTNIPYGTPIHMDAISAAEHTLCRYPSLPNGAVASNGPANDCAIDKIKQFEAELASPRTPVHEQVLALFYIEHLVGDISQPLHNIDNNDAGGNCITVSTGEKTMSLHRFWDDTAVEANERGHNPATNGMALAREITPDQIKAWASVAPDYWSADSYAVAMNTAYQLGISRLPTCDAKNTYNPIELSPQYQQIAAQTAKLQLEKAGVRLALLLNSALGS